ncbi:MAG: hypothetical protein JWP87_2526 [Labilithrix sp.]|nr:hypothetical protein [Labilithrix sp.]
MTTHAPLRRAAVTATLLLGVFALEADAFADRRTEAAAKDAIARADDDYLQSNFDKALKRLRVAERMCGEASCTAPTHAALLRDIGTMELRLGTADAAASSFRRARKLDPTIRLNPSYDTKDLREAWEAAVAPVQLESGDFTHRPAAEQAASTPLPVYVVSATTETLASVVVKYRNDAMRTFRRAVLARAGEGWGGYIPCADVVAGSVHYYVQGFDKDGALAASSGDPNHTFSVPIRESIRGDAPSLPGQTAPAKCGEDDVQALHLDEGSRCQEDRQCKSGTCSSGRCKAVQTFEQEEATSGPRPYARVWIGVAGSMDLTVPAASNEVCAQAAGVSTSGYWCTTADGKDYPPPARQTALVPGRGGAPASEITPGSVHITATIDYAASANLLLGVRFGYVANAYPGDAASAAGKTIGPPIHAEVRGTWVFGDEPLARSGLAPYVFLAAGLARFDTPATVMVAEKGVAGERAVRAWYVAGPGFGGIGAGARYAFSPRVAFSTALGVDAAIAPGAFAVTVSPEMHLQYGF